MLVTVNRTTFTQTIIFSLIHSLRASSSSRVASEACCERHISERQMLPCLRVTSQNNPPIEEVARRLPNLLWTNLLSVTMTTFMEIITCCLGGRERRDDGHVGHWAVHDDHGPEEEIRVKLYRYKRKVRHRLSIKVRKSCIFIWEPWPHITIIESWFVECSASHTRRAQSFLSPVQTDATLLANYSQHCWMLHVASVCTPCCTSCWMLLRKVWNRSNFSANNSQHFFCSVIAEA